MISSAAPSRRTTKRSLNDVRTHLEDELPQFAVSDKISHEIFARDLSSHEFHNTSVVSYRPGMDFWIQSVEFFSGISKFSVKIKTDLTYEAFHTRIQLNVPSLPENRITQLDSFSKLEEVIRFLGFKENSYKENVLQQHIQCMNPQNIGEINHSTDIIIRAFNYFASSRHLYSKLRENYLLPSIKTLQNMTSKVNNLSGQSYITSVFNKLEDRQKECIILVDKIYVKRSLLYHGGRLFGKAHNNED